MSTKIATMIVNNILNKNNPNAPIFDSMIEVPAKFLITAKIK